MHCEVIVCNYAIMMILVCYDANVLDEIEYEMQMIKVKSQRWTSRQVHIII